MACCESKDGGGFRASGLGFANIIASTLGGILTSLAMTPLDVIKIRMQVIKQIYGIF